MPPFARMAESVDAPVSNTGGATHPGSIPGPGTGKRILTARVLFSFIGEDGDTIVNIKNSEHTLAHDKTSTFYISVS